MKNWFKGFVKARGLRYALLAILTASGVGAPVALGIATAADAGAVQYIEAVSEDAGD